MKFFQDATEVTFVGIDKVFNVSSVFCEFTLFGHDFTVMWYGVIIAFGFTLAVLFGGRMAYLWKMDLNKMIDILIYGTIGGIVGARLYFCIFKWDYYSSHLSEIFKIWEGGLAIYGGIIGGGIAAFITSKIIKLNFYNLLDIAGMSFLIGQGIGRWGNYANQEAFGGNTDGTYGMWSEKVRDYIIANQSELPGVNPDMPVHPTFFYESVWCIAGFFILFFITKKFRKFSGQIFLCYGIWYGLGRMIIEGMRTDSLYVGNSGIRVSQLLSAVIVLVCLVLLVTLLIKYKKNPKPIEGIDYYVEPVPFFNTKKKSEKAQHEEITKDESIKNSENTENIDKSESIENTENTENIKNSENK